MKKVKILVFEPFKEAYEKEVKDTLEAYQEIVEGCIETVYIPIKGTILVCNDSGLIDALPKDRGHHGTFFITGTQEGEFVSLTEEQLKEAKAMYNKRKNYPSKSEYLSNFFEEKKVEYKQFNFTVGNTFYSIDTQIIIERLLAIESEDDLKTVENIIRQIDFRNGDIHRFLKYIGEALITGRIAI